jgi:hypothetical protein
MLSALHRSPRFFMPTVAVVVVVSGLALIGLLRREGDCSRACPTPQTQDFSSRVAVKGFAKQFKIVDGSAITFGYVGRPVDDYGALIEAPGTILRTLSADERGDSGLNVLEARGTSTDPNWSGCYVNVWRELPRGVAIYDSDLSDEARAKISSSEQTLIVVGVGCL